MLVLHPLPLAQVVFVGLDQTSAGENFDRNELTLPGVQEELVGRVLAAQPRTVVVLIAGSSISSELRGLPAVMHAFFPGELGGDAIVDALTGAKDAAPAGKMPVTTYHSNFTTRDIRITDLRAAGGITYRHFKGPVLYPFGHGLSYTRFVFTWAQRSPSAGRDANVSQGLQASYVGSEELSLPYEVSVTNEGGVESDCVVLVFIAATADSHPEMPRRRLVSFTRLRAVQPSESRAVRVVVTAEALGFMNAHGERVRTFCTYPYAYSYACMQRPMLHPVPICACNACAELRRCPWQRQVEHQSRWVTLSGPSATSSNWSD